MRQSVSLTTSCDRLNKEYQNVGDIKMDDFKLGFAENFALSGVAAAVSKTVNL